MNLFKYLLEGNLSSYGRIIDWWLSERKFSDWDKKEITRFTKKLHNMKGFSKERDLKYCAVKNLAFPKKASRYPQVWMAKGGAEGRDWVRHIRNGIAHGNVTVRMIKGECVLEILDFHSDEKTQTAYILIPLDYLEFIKKAYDDILQEKRK